MTDPQIRVMLSTEDFRHLVEGGELRVITEKGTACVCLDEAGGTVLINWPEWKALPFGPTTTRAQLHQIVTW